MGVSPFPSVIRSAALRTFGAPGPSGVDAGSWRRICTSFHADFNDLCEAMALFAHRLCTTYICHPTFLLPSSHVDLLFWTNAPAFVQLVCVKWLVELLLRRLFLSFGISSKRGRFPPIVCRSDCWSGGCSSCCKIIISSRGRQ